MGKKLIYTRNIKMFTCHAARGTRKYERTSAIFEACPVGKEFPLEGIQMYMGESI